MPGATGEEPYFFTLPAEELDGFRAMLTIAADAAAEERKRRLKLARAVLWREEESG